MTGIAKTIIAGVVLAVVALGATAAFAQAPEPTDCGQISEAMSAEHARLSTDLRRIQREIAALRSDMASPDARDIFGGIGYIFGLFGVGAYVAARRSKE